MIKVSEIEHTSAFQNNGEAAAWIKRFQSPTYPMSYLFKTDGEVELPAGYIDVKRMDFGNNQSAIIYKASFVTGDDPDAIEEKWVPLFC